MGNKDSEVKRMEVMKQSEVLLKQIETFAKDSTKTATTIAFTVESSKFPANSSDATEMTQGRAQALHNAINTEMQARLSVMGFDTEKNPTVRSQMIYDALKGTIAERIDRLHLDDATGGWSLKSLGLTLGSFAGVPFLLPSVSIGKLQYTQRLHLEGGTKQEKTEVINKDTLFGNVTFNLDKTYSLPLIQNSPLNDKNIIISKEMASVAFDAKTNTITGLKDYGIKVILKDGKYTIAYDMSKPVTANTQ